MRSMPARDMTRTGDVPLAIPLLVGGAGVAAAVLDARWPLLAGVFLLGWSQLSGL